MSTCIPCMDAKHLRCRKDNCVCNCNGGLYTRWQVWKFGTRWFANFGPAPFNIFAGDFRTWREAMDATRKIKPEHIEAMYAGLMTLPSDAQRGMQ